MQITKLNSFFIKEFWWEKNWDDVNWLSTLKKHSQFEIREFFFKLKKNLLNIISKLQESFTTCKWGVMYITSKTNCSLWNIYIYIQFEIKIKFQNEMLNLVESIHISQKFSYPWKVSTKNVMYWKNYVYL